MDGWMQAAGQLAQAGLPSLGSLLGGLAGSALVPGLGTAAGASVGGAFGRAAAAAVGAALGVPPTPEAITQAVAADPEAARLKLSAIEADAKIQADYLADVANARTMQLGLVQTHSWVQNMPAIVTLLIFSAWIVLTVALYFVQAEIPERVYQLLSQAYGAANLALGTAIAFWLGSSRSSQIKDNQITALLPASRR